MSYISKWERLSAAVGRIVSANRISQEEAQTDLCRAIADRKIEFQAKLRKHATRHTTLRNQMVDGKYFDLPPNIKREDFDWENSRPLKPWIIRRGEPYPHGYWDLDFIELCESDVTYRLCGVPPADKSPPALDKKSRRPKSQSDRERARAAMEKMFPGGIPSQKDLPNGHLDRDVNAFLEARERPKVSKDTILRAAGRRK